MFHQTFITASYLTPFGHSDIRARLYNIQMSLPAQLELNSQNLRHSFQDKLDSVFIFLHLILNSLIAISHGPSLFRSLPNQVSEVNDNVSSVGVFVSSLGSFVDHSAGRSQYC